MSKIHQEALWLPDAAVMSGCIPKPPFMLAQNQIMSSDPIQ